MVESASRLTIDVFVLRLLAEIEIARAAGPNDVEELANILISRGFTTRAGRQSTAATINKLLSSRRAIDLSSPIKNE